MRAFPIIIGGAIAASAALAGAATAQSQGSERSYQVGSFEKVAGAGPNHYLVSVGSAPSVRASGPAKTLDRYEVVVRNGELQVRLKSEWRRDKSNRKLKPATYRITLPRISAASYAGSGDMSVDRVDGGTFEANLAGSGRLTINRMAVEKANFSVAGSGNLSASGKARKSDVSIAGSGNVRARQLRSVSASVSVAGSGDTALTVDKDADISIVGSGDVAIAGNARCRISKMGSGKVSCGG